MLLSGLFGLGSGARASAPAPDADYWYEGVSMNTDANVPVTPDSSMQVAAVFACVQVLTETLASLPLSLYQQLDDADRRNRRRASEHPLHYLLHDRPNQYQTSQEFREMLQGHLCLRGNAYAQIVLRNGRVQELLPIHPDRVKPQWGPDRRTVYYAVRDAETGKSVPLNQEQILHLRWITTDGLKGITRIEQMRHPVAFGRAADIHGAKLHGNGAVPGGALVYPGKLNNRAKRELRADWEAMHAGASRGFRVAVLDRGLQWQSIGLSAKDAQFLENRRFQLEEIARCFRVPLHLVGSLDKATYSNIEQQDIGFAKHIMVPWCTRWEQALRRDVITGEGLERYYAEFNLLGLERGDAAARSQYYRELFYIGVLSINEIRALENLAPVEGGDEHFVPLNMTRLGEAAAGILAPQQNNAMSALAVLLQQEKPGSEAPAAARPLLGHADTEPIEPSAGGLPDATQKALARLAADAADRIVAAELATLRKKASLAEKDADGFAQWAAGYYAKHATYMRKTLAPLGAAYCCLTKELPDWAGLVDDYCGRSRALLDAGELRSILPAWKGAKAKHLTSQILEDLACTSPT